MSANDIAQSNQIHPHLSLIVAFTKNRVIGKDNDMPWHLPADLKYFKAKTMGKPVIMGRKTFESIGRPLPGRKNIVISRQNNLKFDGAQVVHSLDEAMVLAKVDYDGEVMLIGGAQLYLQAIEQAAKLYVTHIDTEVEGDAFFPEFSRKDWEYQKLSAHTSDDQNMYNLEFGIYSRISL